MRNIKAYICLIESNRKKTTKNRSTLNRNRTKSNRMNPESSQPYIQWMVETKNLDTASGSIRRMEPMKLSSRVNGYLCVVLHFLQADTHLDIEGFLLLVSSSVLGIEIYGLCFLRLYSTEYKQYSICVAFWIQHLPSI